MFKMPRIWREWNRDLRLIATSLFAWGIGEGLFLSFVTLRLEGLGAAPAQIGNIMALYAFVMALVMIPAGIATDRWGAWRVMVGAWLVAFIAVVLMAASNSLWLFAFGWVSYGLTSWIVPAITTYVTNGCGDLPPERALAMTYAAYSAGLIFSPTLGGMLGEQVGLRAPFAVAIVFILASIVAIAFVRQDAPQQVDLSNRYSRYGTLLRNRPFLLLMGLSFVVMLAFWLGVPLAPNYLQNRWGVPLARIGIFGSAEAVGGVVLSLVLSRISPLFSLAVLHIGMFVYLSTLLTTDQTLWLALAFFLRVGPIYGRQFVDCIAMRLVPSSQRGVAFALSPTVQRFANMVAALIAGWLYEFRPELPFQVSFIVGMIALVGTFIIIPPILAERNTAIPAAGNQPD